MTKEQWKAFQQFRDDFRAQCAAWGREAGCEAAEYREAGSPGTTANPLAETPAVGWLAKLEQGAADADNNPAYPLETPIVYNQALDGITEADEIRLLVIGDNPGKDEQLVKNRRYLVGQAGKLGAGFFRNNPELGVDFRKNAIILNKTPIHTAKTKQLAWIRKKGGDRFERLFVETQRWMAERTIALARALDCGIWLVGYGELREKGLFAEYAKALKAAAFSSGSMTASTQTAVRSGDSQRVESCAISGRAGAQFSPGGRQPESSLEATAIDLKILLFQHFSMNRFSIDLKERYNPAEDMKANLERVGLFHRREILGW